MKISETLLPEFDQEMANTRKSLERIPENKLDWRPHKKSWTMGELASHIANLLTWSQIIIDDDSFDLETSRPKLAPPTSTKEILDWFDKNFSATRETIAKTSDEQLLSKWSLLSSGKTIFSLPRVAVLRSFVFNHSIHHRAQLGVYLRLNDIPVPAIYGPSADESGM